MPAYIVIICSFLLRASILGTDIFFFHLSYTLTSVRSSYSICLAISYLLYPLLGWLSDVYFTRYKVIRLAFATLTMVFVACTIITSAIVINPEILTNMLAVCILLPIALPGLVLLVLGFGLFEANAIQFGMDQLLEASSDQLSAFIHWYYWSSYIGRFLMTLLSWGLLLYHGSCTQVVTDSVVSAVEPLLLSIGAQLFNSMAVIQLPLAVIGLCLLIHKKNDLSIERPGHNPLKLVYGVLKYAWNHTCPENRSAFTYWEEDIPPRIDLGMNKYGGPFTTEEVEDTKSFLRILLLLFSLMGFHLSGHGYSSTKQLMRTECPPPWLLAFVGDPMTLTTITILIGIPLYRFISSHCCQNYLPNMMKRMGLGLLCCLLKGIIEIVLQVTQSVYSTQKCTNHWPLISCYLSVSQMSVNGTCTSITAPSFIGYCSESNSIFLLLLIIPQVLQGLTYLLVFMTALEFICAQAPLRLKGLLIGIWYALLAVHYLPVAISEVYIIDSTTWGVFHEVKTFLTALSFISYLYVSRHYRYRVRDEVVNEQFLVEEIYEREMDLAEEYEREEREEMRALLGDSQSRSNQYGTTDEEQVSSRSE